MIVAIEGLDASGKATQSKILAEALGGAVVSFPTYSTPAGQAILGNLKQEWSIDDGGGLAESERTNALVLQCLMTINRFEVLPAIQEFQAAGTPIVFDRYWASAIVYGTMDGLDRSWIELIQAQLPEPDYWVFLDVSPEESVKRRPERRDRYEKDPHAAERRQRYLSLWKEHDSVLAPIGLMNGRVRFAPKAWSVVDGVGTVDEVHRRILAAVGVESGVP